MSSSYSCTMCGKGFTRRSSAVRHVDTVHKGDAAVVTTEQYISGLHAGTTLPPFERPTYKGKIPEKPSITEMIEEKFVEKLVDRSMDKAFDKLGLGSSVETYFELLIKRDFPNEVSEHGGIVKKIQDAFLRKKKRMDAEKDSDDSDVPPPRIKKIKRP